MKPLAIALLTIILPCSAMSADLTSSKTAAKEHAAALDENVTEASMALWNFSEIALREHQSAEYLADWLEKNGFRVQRGVAGMPTAFVAEYGIGRPIIGITAEYDALPNIGNDPVPARQPREDGNPHGHGCGHNLFGAGSVGAAIALKRTMEERGIGGTIRLYGAPAEETLIGKVYMANAGLFDDLDAALDWHPITETAVGNEQGQAMNNFEVEFFGKASHGAVDPWNGRSALDAVEIMNTAVNMMREHIETTARIHYVIQNGGEAPNVVPAYAKVWYYLRDVDREKVERNYAWMLDIIKGAALATQTDYKVTLLAGVHELMLNRPLQEAMQVNLDDVGPPSYSEADQQFARELQTYLEREPVGLSTSVNPLGDASEVLGGGGSTDVAEISWKVPTVSLMVASAGQNLPWHSWATSASHGRPSSAKSAQVAARVLAMTGIDLLLRPELLEAARADHATRREGRPYVSPIPLDQKPPLPEE